jgi:Ca-activated chloride channel family protein
VIDNSGSMAGTSIAQAKASLIYGLGHLQPAERFNVIRFDHTLSVLFPSAVPADAERPGHLFRDRAAGRRRHGNGAGDARGAERSAGR